MRVTTIPDNEIWAGATRIVMGPPEGHDPTGEIRALEMLAEIVMGHRAYSARCVLEDGDLETLAAGGVVWLTFYGGVAPFSITVAPAAGTATTPREGTVATFIVRTGNPKVLDETVRGLPGIHANVVDDTWNHDQQTCHVHVQGDADFFRYAMATQGYGDVLGEVDQEPTGGGTGA